MSNMRAWLGAFGGVAFTGAIVLACTTDYQKGVDDPNYGGPNALSNTKAPPAFGSTATGDSDAGSSGLKCGTAVTPDPACTVSFKDKILPTLTATCVGSSCHTTTDPIITADAKTTYDNFVKFATSVNKFYINPCSKDDTQSIFACNLEGATGCGVKMPLSGTYDAAKIADIRTWLKCGSPNN